MELAITIIVVATPIKSPAADCGLKLGLDRVAAVVQRHDGLVLVAGQETHATLGIATGERSVTSDDADGLPALAAQSVDVGTTVVGVTAAVVGVAVGVVGAVATGVVDAGVDGPGVGGLLREGRAGGEGEGDEGQEGVVVASQGTGHGGLILSFACRCCTYSVTFTRIARFGRHQHSNKKSIK